MALREKKSRRKGLYAGAAAAGILLLVCLAVFAGRARQREGAGSTASQGGEGAGGRNGGGTDSQGGEGAGGWNGGDTDSQGSESADGRGSESAAGWGGGDTDSRGSEGAGGWDSGGTDSQGSEGAGGWNGGDTDSQGSESADGRGSESADGWDGYGYGGNSGSWDGQAAGAGGASGKMAGGDGTGAVSDGGSAASGGLGPEPVLAGEAPAGGRICEYTGISLPECLKKGDYIDLRISFADGRDYTVLPGKRVESCRKDEAGDFLRLVLAEEEILLLSGARTDARVFSDTSLYAVICIDPEKDGYQVNYPAGEAVRELLSGSPNIRSALPSRKNAELDKWRKENNSSQGGMILKDPIQYWMEQEE